MAEKHKTIKDAIIHVIDKDRLCALAVFLAVLGITPHLLEGVQAIVHDVVTRGVAAKTLTEK